MYFIDIILIFILHTNTSCYLFVSSIIMYIFLPRVSVLRYMKILWSYDTLLGEVILLLLKLLLKSNFTFYLSNFFYLIILLLLKYISGT